MLTLTWQDLLSVLGALASFMVTLVVLMVFYRERRRGHYDEARHRVELELMRRSIETQMYQLSDRMVATESRWRDANHLLLASQNLQAPLPPPGSLITPNSFLEASGISKDGLEVENDLIFVLTPFHPAYNDEFDIIASVCRDLNLKAQRGDETFVEGEVFPHILRLIAKARLIIANVDGRNPNVFYELGIAHALSKPTILISKTPDDVPFDIRSKRLVLYTNPTELRERLRNELARAFTGPR